MEQKEFITADQLDYKKKDYIHPSYELYKIYQQNGGTTATATVAGGTESIFEIPAKCVNFNRSFLKFQYVIPAVGVDNSFNRAFMDCMPHIRQIQLYTRGNVYLCDLQGANNYTKVVWNPETKIQDFLQNPIIDFDTAADPTQSTPSAYGEGFLFQRSDDQKTYFTGQAADAPAVAIPEAGIRSQRPTLGDDGSDLNYTEQMYVMRSFMDDSTAVPDPTVSTMNINVNLPLGLYKNTILSVDKDLYFNNEVLLLRIVWESSNRIAYFNDADAGAAGNPDTAATALAVNINISNLYLYLAVEKNPMIVTTLIEKVKTGFNVMVPYVHTYVNSLSDPATLQSVTVRLNRGHGIKLLKIYHALFNNTNTSNTAYDHNNINGVKTTSYYSLLNNNRLQQFDLQTNDLQDWNYHQDYLKESTLQTPNIYQYNWFHCDNWTSLPAVESDKLDNYDTGINLDVEQKWDIYFTTANAIFRHNTFVIVQRLLSISPSGIVLI